MPVSLLVTAPSAVTHRSQIDDVTKRKHDMNQAATSFQSPTTPPSGNGDRSATDSIPPTRKRTKLIEELPNDWQSYDNNCGEDMLHCGEDIPSLQSTPVPFTTIANMALRPSEGLVDASTELPTITEEADDPQTCTTLHTSDHVQPMSATHSQAPRVVQIPRLDSAQVQSIPKKLKA